MLHRMRGLGIPGGRFIASWAGAVGLGFALFGLVAGVAQAQTVTEFSIITAGAQPFYITAGPDGNLWFPENAGNRIGRITPAGVVTEFSAGITARAFPAGITAGPDGNMWFTEAGVNRIGRITPVGVVTEFSAGITANISSINPYGWAITAGPDGNLWFTKGSDDYLIGRITPAGVVTEFFAGITGRPNSITAGPDGNLWFTEPGANLIGRITPAGVVTEFSAGITANSNPSHITVGADGNLWFTEGAGRRIGRITPTGVVTEFRSGITAGAGLVGITAGPDGNLWFTEYNGNRIGRITPAGIVTEFSDGISANAGPRNITAGPDGNLWFAELDGNRIGRITTGASFTPLPPPPIMQTEYTVTTGVIPEAAVSTTASGTLGSVTLNVTLNLSLLAGFFTGQGQFAAGYNVYVVALVPSGRLGLPAATWFMLPSTRNWTRFGIPMAAYLQNVSQSASVSIGILQNMDMTALIGTEFYIGYGLSDEEMLNARRYRGVYIVR